MPSALAIVLFVAGCAGQPQQPGAGAQATAANAAAVPTSTIAEVTTQKEPQFDDLPAMRQRGILRVLQPDIEANDHLARAGRPIEQDRELLARFAEGAGLKIDWIVAPPGTSLIQSVVDGHADVAAASLTVTPERKKLASFTVPVGHAREMLVTRRNDRRIAKLSDLNDRTIVVKRASSYWATAMAYRAQYPKMKVVEAPPELSAYEVLERVASGEYDLSIADDYLVAIVQGYQPALVRRFALTGERPLAWAVRHDNPQLRKALDVFLNDEHLTRPRRAIYTGDLPEIRKRRVLRVLTSNDPVTYFLWRGEMMGFEYDLVRHLAADLGVRVEMIVAPSQAELIPWLKAGRGDLIAASLTITDDRIKQGVRFSRPYLYVSEVLVARSDEREIASLADLRGRRVIANESSAYWPGLVRMQKDAGFELVPALPGHSTRELIDLVAQGKHDFTVADSHILESELTWRQDVKAAFMLSETARLGWAVRAADTQLRAAVDKFLAREYRGLFYNVTREKYFGSRERPGQRERLRLDANGRISPYDELIRKYASQHEFDWRLVAAQMYRESRFNPKARSWAGAQGLLQLMPRTAQALGVRRLDDPESSIHGGLKYLAQLRERFPRELPVADRTWFALASYNAGHGHVSDARTLARQKGLNPDRWFDHVEQAMLLLARPEYAAKARHGYVRGSEPVGYVREIRDYLQAYVQAGF
jgi:membrane-bound lytic murein transglycosylase F